MKCHWASSVDVNVEKFLLFTTVSLPRHKTNVFFSILKLFFNKEIIRKRKADRVTLTHRQTRVFQQLVSGSNGYRLSSHCVTCVAP